MAFFYHIYNKMDITLNKPEPVQLKKNVIYFNHKSDLLLTIESLKKGAQVIITGVYQNGLLLLKELQNNLKESFENHSFSQQRTYREEYQKLSNLILLEISNQKIVLKKSPNIGWLDQFYSDLNNFYLPLPQIQGLNSSWQWYLKGINLPVLRNKLHPYYGTYFPTRFEHLELFDKFLLHYKGYKKSALEVGVGSGVLAMQMVKHGFQKVFATDTNPNAIIGLKEFMGDTKLSRKIELDFGDLFGKWEKPSELIVFNPPWLPQSSELNKIDEAIYYDQNLFPEFFKEAKKRLLPEGKLVLIFSNLAQITGVTEQNPIEQELINGGRFILHKCYKKAVKKSSAKNNRDSHWREEENVELWILTH